MSTPKLMSVFNFPGLPAEMNHEIFSYLEAEYKRYTRRQFAKVLRELAHVTSELWAQLDDDDNEGYITLAKGITGWCIINGPLEEHIPNRLQRAHYVKFIESLLTVRFGYPQLRFDTIDCFPTIYLD
jgi:hypothetical protein